MKLSVKSDYISFSVQIVASLILTDFAQSISIIFLSMRKTFMLSHSLFVEY